MVRDLYEPHEGARVMARALTGLGILALTGPLLGAVIVNAWGWRMTFAACAIYVVGDWLGHLAEETQRDVEVFARPPLGAAYALLQGQQAFSDTVGNIESGEKT